jgi:hypothetical protein
MRISVIGHRSVADRSKAIGDVRACLSAIVGSPRKNAAFDLASNLAEGADLLAVEAAGAWPRMRLIAVLPLTQAEYARDVTGAGTREELAAALRRATEVIELPARASRPDSYRQAGHYLVDHCDHLIAMWDGQESGRAGGTADTLAYARERLDPSQIHVVSIERGSVEARR